nr:hypothetical protein CFP56_72538 [Quercus suber]
MRQDDAVFAKISNFTSVHAHVFPSVQRSLAVAHEYIYANDLDPNKKGRTAVEQVTHRGVPFQIHTFWSRATSTVFSVEPAPPTPAVHLSIGMVFLDCRYVKLADQTWLIQRTLYPSRESDRNMESTLESQPGYHQSNRGAHVPSVRSLSSVIMIPELLGSHTRCRKQGQDPNQDAVLSPPVRLAFVSYPRGP